MPKRTRIHLFSAAMMFLSIYPTVLSPGLAHATGCSASGDGQNLCPFPTGAKACWQVIAGVKVPDPGCTHEWLPFNLFDRCFGDTHCGADIFCEGKPTPMGNWACDELKIVKNLSDEIRDGLEAERRKAEQEVNTFFRQFVFAPQGCWDNTLARKFNEVRDIADAISRDTTGYLKGECGANGVLRGVEQTCRDIGANFQSVGSIGAASFEVLTKAGPVLLTAGDILINDIPDLTKVVAGKGKEAKAKLDALTNALKRLNDAGKKLGSMDFLGNARTTLTMVAEVGPFVVSGGACGKLLLDAAIEIGTGVVVDVQGLITCIPTEGISCLEALPGTGIALLGGLEGAIATPVCDSFKSQLEDGQKKLDSIIAFFEALKNTIDIIIQSSNDIAQAVRALAELAELLGEEAKPIVDRIAGKINTMSAGMAAVGEAVSTKVLPAVSLLTQQLLDQLVRNVNNVAACYEKATALVGRVGDRAGEGFNKLVEAARSLSNSLMMLQRYQDNLDDAQRAVADAAAQKWNAEVGVDLNWAWNITVGANFPTGPGIPHTPDALLELAKSSGQGNRDRLGRIVTGLPSGMAAVATAATNAGIQSFSRSWEEDLRQCRNWVVTANGLIGQASSALQGGRGGGAPSLRRLQAIGIGKLPAAGNIQFAKVGALRFAPKGMAQTSPGGAGGGSGQTAGGRTPSGSGLAPAADSAVISASVKVLDLKQGGTEVIFGIAGTNLGSIKEVGLLAGQNPVPGTKARVVSANPTSIKIAAQALTTAAVGKGYSLILVFPNNVKLLVPQPILAVNVLAAPAIAPMSGQGSKTPLPPKR